jgi:hypothetical protein
MSSLWQNIFQLVGAICEIAGVVLMARVYVNLKVMSTLYTMLSGLLRGKRARNRAKTMKQLPALAEQQHLASFQGLSFIALGFLLTAIPPVINILLQIIC